MKLPLFQVDAFTERVFYGNPAAICPLDEWLDEDLMQSIALENNLPETAFLVARGDDYEIRWFTPSMEAELCGHATLASAHVVFTELRPDLSEVVFHSGKGPLRVSRLDDGQLALGFPALPVVRIDPPARLLDGLSINPTAVYAGMDYVALYETEEQMCAVTPDQNVLLGLDRRAVTITAPGVDHDFSSRFFAPKQAILEDAFTGSAHCLLIPFWADRVGRRKLVSRQHSTRLGLPHVIEASCTLVGDRVTIAGHTRSFMSGTICFDEGPADA
ncbi:PhzF family phenazine biosynthesis protein [Amycolatopsis sp. NPDC051061]|uniref:PhzF family phenazine biosynthesis protein n=1 Tax=Amycolatopsis sp. NPDC051061 TaxID=3155042 RepID=UPI003430C59A